MVSAGYGGSQAVAYASESVRADFIRRVYTLFFGSLLVTVFAGWFAIQPAVLPVVAGLMMPLLIAGFVCVIALSFARRTSGLNVGLLYLFAAIEGLVFGPLLLMMSQNAPGLVSQAGFLTVAVFGGLSLYAMQSRRDFNYLGGFLFVGLIGLLVAGVLQMFFHASWLGTVYALGGVLIFSGYVLYDTSQIMRRLGPDEAVVGAVSLYLDFLNLFLFILRLLSNDRR